MQEAKALVRSYYEAFDKAKTDDLESVMAHYCNSDFTLRGCYPFVELKSVKAVCEELWVPLRQAIKSIQRRPDIFMAGENSLAKSGEIAENGIKNCKNKDDNSIWVCSYGHLMGLHDKPWMNIPPTRKMAFLRYCEFHQVQNGKIVHQALWLDIPYLMVQSGVNPFPPQTGVECLQPGPMTHEGLMYDEQDPKVSQKTLDTMNGMITAMDNWKADMTLEEELALTWHDDMIWWGPTGIGSSYTIERYAKQHSGPMRQTCKDRKFYGHVCRMAEGHFGGWFGWPNLTVTLTGGFCGMPASDKPCDMRVIDLYRREGDKLAENWVLIDMLWFWKQQGLDVLERLKTYLS